MQKELSEYKYLRFSELSQIVFWDYYSLTNQHKIDAHFPIVKLREVLHQRKGFITIDNAETYKRCRVQLYGKGVVLRDEVQGSVIKTKKQQVCKKDDFLVAEIDAKFGGYGIVPEGLDGAIVSGHYFLFEIDTSKLLPSFLGLVIKLEQFSKQVKATGSTNYAAIRPQHVLGYEIPLPDLTTQYKLVQSYYTSIDEAEDLLLKISGDNNVFDLVFKEALQLEFDANKTSRKGLYFAEYSNLLRWDIWNNGNQLSSKKYDFIQLKNVVIGKPEYGANVKAISKVSETRYIRITDINEDGSLNDEVVSAEQVDEKYLLEENDFLIARSGNTVGKTYLYSKDVGRAIYAGYLIRFKLDVQRVNPTYLLYYTKSKAFKLWIASNQRVSGQPNINGQEFLAAPIILPEIEVQNAIVEKLSGIRFKIKEYKDEAKRIISDASYHFEKALFKCS